MTVVFDRAVFFDHVRRAPFGNRLAQRQVDGMTAILDTWEAEHAGDDLRWLAYMFATVFHETGGRMVPVREGFARTDAQARKILAHYRYAAVDPETGQSYYGRGLPQITWRKNYRRMGGLIGVDLEHNPDLALDPVIAVKILYEGMLRGVSMKGDFTGKSLEDYFNKDKDDPVGARRIINGTDKASLIAGYHGNFLDSLKAAAAAVRKVGEKVVAKPVSPAAAPAVVAKNAEVSASAGDAPTLTKDRTSVGGVLTGLGGIGGISMGIAPIMGSLNNPWAFGFAALLLVVISLGIYLVVTGRLDLRYKAGV